MITITGERIFPDGHEMDSGQAPSLYSIGAGLGRIARFAGQTRLFYTVLPHTFTVSELVSSEARPYALLHDAPEAIVGDVPTPWKSEGARAHEVDLLERITRSVKLDWPWPTDIAGEVHEADAIALAAEAHTLGHAEADTFWPLHVQSSLIDRAIEATRQRCRWTDLWVDPKRSGPMYRDAVHDAIEVIGR